MAQRSRRARARQRFQEQQARQVRAERQALQAQDGLPFRKLLAPERIAAALTAAGIEFRERIYTPMVTLWAFLSQVVGTTNGSCEDAVARIAADRAARGRGRCSPDTSSYCEARARLPEEVLRRLALETGQQLHQGAQSDWLWKGRSVKIADGSTALLPDTPENQAAYPQSSTQKKGLGFPMVRFVVILSLAAGAVLECAVGACAGKGTGELTLFRQLWKVLVSGDILLADRLYDSFRDISQLKARGVDCLCGMHVTRRPDFRRGRQLGQDDHVVVWHKPRYNHVRYDSREQWEALPESIEMREIRRVIRRKGLRTRKVVLVTTLLDAKLYPAADVAALFAQRWNCELDLRSIKRSLGMYQLRCRTPEMARKELWTYLLGYNLIRARMAQAAAVHDCPPRKLSFTGARTQMEHFGQRMQSAADPQTRDRIELAMLAAIAGCRVGDRPDRKEPRELKRRSQKYPLMTKPRTQARQRLTA